MRGPDGGSLHDPHANLPVPMWDRSPKPTTLTCAACRGHSERHRTPLHQLQVAGGPAPGPYLMCPRCDGGPGWRRE